MADLAKQLVEAVEKAFTHNCKTDILVSGIEKTLKKNGVSYREAEEYAARLGELLAKSYRETITPELLPEGRLDADLAEELLRTLLTQNYERAAEVAARVQTSLNRAAGLGMKGLPAEVNTQRMNGLIQKAGSYETYEKAAWTLDEPVVNYTQSAVEDTLRKNADAHFKSGLHPVIKRISVGGCCKWCNSLAGTYDYPVKREIYKRHERCRCLVLYDPGNGKIQNAHTKREYESAKAAEADAEKARRRERVEKRAADEAKYPEARRVILGRVRSGEYSLELKHQKYLQHVEGTAQYNLASAERGKPQSYLTITEKEAQDLINRFTGLGDPMIDNKGQVGNSEFFSTGRTIGYYHENGEPKATDRIQIVHGKKGSHIVPVKPLED